VVFVYRSSENAAREIEEKYSSLGMKVVGIKADVSSTEEATEAVKRAEEFLGGIDVLVNNAGITKDNLLLRMSPEEFDAVVDANLKSVFNFTKAVLRTMLRERAGSIINITSIVGLIGNAGQSNYAASKAGIIGFTKSIAKEIASRNIRVNAVAPGFIQTDMTEVLTEEQKSALLNSIPLGRMGTPEDIAKVVKFLASDDSAYITGQVITVDGGMVM
jgi:3-oxoacyl-[acyl-carrier protein] reductase